MDFATLRFDTTQEAADSPRHDETETMHLEPAPDPSCAPAGSADGAARLRRLRQASAQGSANAQFEIGCLFHAGELVAHDDAEAATWWGMAALGGHARAQCELGRLHLLGRGVARDPAIARMWLESAAAQREPSAQYELGMLALEAGAEGAEVAARWFALASARSHPCAQYRLGLAYRDGDGVERDDAYAMHWLDAASAQGCALAAYTLAELGWRGWRVPPRRRTRDSGCDAATAAAVCRVPR